MSRLVIPRPRPIERFRHLHIMPGPGVADPTFQIRIIETPLGSVTSDSGPQVAYAPTWRVRLICWLIRRWLPYPDVWNVRRVL